MVLIKFAQVFSKICPLLVFLVPCLSPTIYFFHFWLLGTKEFITIIIIFRLILKIIWPGVAWPLHSALSHVAFCLVTAVTLEVRRSDMGENCHPRKADDSLETVFLQTEAELVQTVFWRLSVSLIPSLSPPSLSPNNLGDVGPHSSRVRRLRVSMQVLTTHSGFQASWKMSNHFIQLPYVKKRRMGCGDIMICLGRCSCIPANGLSMPGTFFLQCVCT